ncbi:MAG TPA: hypothetical protein VFP84_40895 [Kofleriaceae bacterium]|nr:hypothetical protein [Kofleriaceae bacterium]
MTKLKHLVFVLPLVLAACGGGNDGNGPRDAGGTPGIDAGGGTPDAACFTDPKTYKEIINACTDSVQVFKDSHPPLLNPDGTVPKLPGT